MGSYGHGGFPPTNAINGCLTDANGSPDTPRSQLMTTDTSFHPSTGDFRHLKLFSPVKPCAFRSSARQLFDRWETLNLAFQHATGWQLSIRESRTSYQFRKCQGSPGIPAIPELAIVDLSPLLPPGIPAVSRIYCEKLIDETNRMLEDLGQRLHQVADGSLPPNIRQNGVARRPVGPIGDQDVAGAIAAIALDSPQSKGKALLQNSPPKVQSNVPLVTDQLAIYPLRVAERKAACEWFIDDSGVARFAAMTCRGREPDYTRELVAARATFLAECRHGTDITTTHSTIKSTVSRLFPWESPMEVVTGTISLLTGEIEVIGVGSFVTLATFPLGERIANGTRRAVFHLPRGQHLVFCQWPESLNLADVQDWSRQTSQRLHGLALSKLPEAFQWQLEQSIPSLARPPLLALSLSRPG